MAFCGNCFREIGNSSICSFCGYDAAADMAKHAVALRVGSILNGRYIVGRVLGQGGFGITYCALDYENKRLVAIKEHYPSALVIRTGTSEVRLVSSDVGASFNEGKEKFLDEAKTLSQFNGLRNVCDIYSYFEENGTAYFAMEYVDGIALDEYLKRQGRLLGFEEALRLLLPVMQTLSRIHSAGIIHRDLAPDNIMITPYNGVMLIDFGAARYSMGEKSRSLDVILKHGFAPKEQYARRSRQGAYTDVYALAATLYFAITGKVPPDAIERSDDDELIPPSKLGIKIPHKAEQVLLKALAVDYKNRFQTMDEFIQRLTPFLPDLKKEMEAKLAAERKTQAEKLAAERKDKAERRTEERKSAEEKRLAEKKALEEIRKTKEEQKALEAAKRAEAKAAKKAKADSADKPKRKTLIALIAALAAVAIGAGAFFAMGGDKADSPVAAEEIFETEAPEVTEAPAPTPEPAEISWELSDDGTLTISGKGPMEDYDLVLQSSGTSPWVNNNVKKVVILPGITSVGDCAFAGCESITEISLPEGIVNIGYGAFLNCGALYTINLPSTVEEIERLAFLACDSLHTVEFSGTEQQWTSTKIDDFNAPLTNADISFTAIAAGEINNNISWTLDSYGALTISGTGNMPVFSVKNENNFLKGNAPWCSDELRGKVRSVVIGHGITDVGKLAFVNCTNLREVSFPETLEKIGNSAFHCCDGLTELNFPEGFKKIDAYAFNSCRYIRKVSLPASLESIGEGAFQFCNGLGTVEFGGSKEQWENIYIVSINNEKLLNANIRCALIAAGEAGENISWALDNSGTLTISGKGMMEDYTAAASSDNPAPWRLNGLDSKITKVVIGPGVTSVGSHAFWNCSQLREAVLCEGIKEIGLHAFRLASSLSAVDFPDSLEFIGDYAFSGCSLRDISLPKSIKGLGKGVFNECGSLRSIAIPEGIENLPDSLFFNCNNLSEVTLPSTLKSINNHVFSHTRSLSSIVIPEGVTSLGASVFDQSGLTHISLPSSIELIGNVSFRDCSSLRTVQYTGSKEQWNKVKIISQYDREKLNAIVEFAAIATGEAGENISWVLDNNGTLTISGKGAITDCTWFDISPLPEIRRVVIEPGITHVADFAFNGFGELTEVQLPEGLKGIGAAAFNMCQGLRSIKIPEGVEMIPRSLFYNCSDLQSIELPSTLKTIEGRAFMGCYNLSRISVPEGVETIPAYAFYYCRNLQSIELPSTLKTIEDHAFENGDITIYYAGTEQQWNEVKGKGGTLSKANVIFSG